MYLIKEQAISTKDTTETHQGASINIRAGYLKVDLCITPRNRQFEAGDLWFPGIIDTGHSHNLSLTKPHVQNWARRVIGDFVFSGHATVTGANGITRGLPRYDATLWVKSNLPESLPYQIPLDRGFTYYEEAGPPLPLVGVRALQSGGLHLSADYNSMSFSVCHHHQLFGEWLVTRKVITREQLGIALHQQVTLRVPVNEISVLADRHRFARVLQLRSHPKNLGSSIGRIAHDDGIISRGDLAHFDFRDGHVDSRLGKILVGSGALTDDTLQKELELHRDRQSGQVAS